MTDDAGGETELGIDELETYLHKVREELGVREARVASLEREHSELRFKQARTSPQRHLLKGDPLQIQAAAGYLRKMAGLLKDLEAELKEAREDVARARERKMQVEDELKKRKEI